MRLAALDARGAGRRARTSANLSIEDGALDRSVAELAWWTEVIAQTGARAD